MTKEKLQKNLTIDWQRRVFNEGNIVKRDNGIFFREYEKESKKEYFCYAGIDKYGRGYVHIYDSIEECDKNELKQIPVIESMVYVLKEYIRNTKCNIKYFFQRAIKGYCDKDLWAFETWFLNIIPKMLRELKEKPAYMPTNEKGNIIHSLTHEEKIGGYERWQKIIESIAFELDDANNNEQNPYDIIKSKKKHYKWFKDSVDFKNKHLKKGFELLLKYFWYLGY